MGGERIIVTSERPIITSGLRELIKTFDGQIFIGSTNTVFEINRWVNEKLTPTVAIIEYFDDPKQTIDAVALAKAFYEGITVITIGEIEFESGADYHLNSNSKSSDLAELLIKIKHS